MYGENKVQETPSQWNKVDAFIKVRTELTVLAADGGQENQ